MPNKFPFKLAAGVLFTAVWVGDGCKGSSPARSDGRGPSEIPGTVPAGVSTRVTLGPTELRYFEGEQTITLSAKMESDQQGPFYTVSLPTAKAWTWGMPEWSRHRRESIATEIKRLTTGQRIKWVDQE